MKDKISVTEVIKTRQLIGQLNWLATQTRPDLSYDEKEKSQIAIPDLENLEELKIVTYSNASFGNLTDGGSQGGYILFFSWKQWQVYAHCLIIQAY